LLDKCHSQDRHSGVVSADVLHDVSVQCAACAESPSNSFDWGMSGSKLTISGEYSCQLEASLDWDGSSVSDGILFSLSSDHVYSAVSALKNVSENGMITVTFSTSRDPVTLSSESEDGSRLEVLINPSYRAD